MTKNNVIGSLSGSDMGVVMCVFPSIVCYIYMRRSSKWGSALDKKRLSFNEETTVLKYLSK